MSFRRLRIVLTVVIPALAVAFAAPTPARGGPVSALAIGKTAVDGTPTGVGFADVDVTPPSSSGTGFVNIVCDLDRNGSTGNDWLVRNFPLPLHPDAFGGDGTAGQFSFPFALDALSPGGSFTVFSSFDDQPIVAPNTGSMSRTNGVGFRTDDTAGLRDANPGLATGAHHGRTRTAAQDSRAALTPAAAPAGNSQVRKNIPGIKQGKNECGPVAAAQSLLWLAQNKGLKGLPAQADLINALKVALKWTATGVTSDNFVAGKRVFLKTLENANKSKRLVSNKGGTSAGTGTLKFIEQEIKDGEDVEMSISFPDGSLHFVTVAGFFDDGTSQKLYFKDPLTGGTGVDGYTLNGTMIVDYKYGAGAKIGFAVGESVIPLPAPIWGAIGGVAVVMLHQWWRARFRRVRAA